jgi:hypothetical protein
MPENDGNGKHNAIEPIIPESKREQYIQTLDMEIESVLRMSESLFDNLNNCLTKLKALSSEAGIDTIHSATIIWTMDGLSIIPTEGDLIFQFDITGLNIREKGTNEELFGLDTDGEGSENPS